METPIDAFLLKVIGWVPNNKFEMALSNTSFIQQIFTGNYYVSSAVQALKVNKEWNGREETPDEVE